ncbi:hypothetical protein QR680_006841 [Steinernema hermaphroditum]|uniref:Apple domain-containing protein n=1 Tax=Steinernema hermaphroditum TaxID=289476 RepID=A0AA39HZ74_9BILA|nr:hypothetical protein QR680_006841 [Steinernema hermaphroditum]
MGGMANAAGKEFIFRGSTTKQLHMTNGYLNHDIGVGSLDDCMQNCVSEPECKGGLYTYYNRGCYYLSKPTVNKKNHFEGRNGGQTSFVMDQTNNTEQCNQETFDGKLKKLRAHLSESGLNKNTK